MESGLKVVERHNANVVTLKTEIVTALNSRVEYYMKAFGWSKRRIVEDALLCWLNQRDMEAEKEKTGSRS